MFRSGLAPPLLQPLVASLVVLVLTIAWRFMVADKDKRLLRQSFALYLAPAVVGRMLASSRPPELGGEARTVTIYFSDVAGFSSFSEHMQPHEIVALMNDYLSAMTGIIEEHGGVDKYIGDAIVAVFGAPADDPHHAANGVRAARNRCGSTRPWPRVRCRQRGRPTSMPTGEGWSDGAPGPSRRLRPPSRAPLPVIPPPRPSTRAPFIAQRIRRRRAGSRSTIWMGSSRSGRWR